MVSKPFVVIGVLTKYSTELKRFLRITAGKYIGWRMNGMGRRPVECNASQHCYFVSFLSGGPAEIH